MSDDDTDVCDEKPRGTPPAEVTYRIGMIAAALVVLGTVAAIFVGCDRADERERDVRKACITAGGTWVGGTTDIDGHCLRLRTTP